MKKKLKKNEKKIEKKLKECKNKNAFFFSIFLSFFSCRSLDKWNVSSFPVYKNEIDSLDQERMLKLSADRIENIFWFGIFEDLGRSLQLLQFQLNLSKPLFLPKFDAKIEYPQIRSFRNLKLFLLYIHNALAMNHSL